jgi:hypothetical protein
MLRLLSQNLEGKPASVVHEVDNENISQVKIQFEINTSWINENKDGVGNLINL